MFSGDNGPDSHQFQFFDDPGPFRGKKRSLHEGGVRQVRDPSSRSCSAATH
jgi:hypothetical protein